MPNDLETRILNGQGFEAPRSPSPARSVGSDAANTDDELGSDLSGPSRSNPAHEEHIELPDRKGPQTGVKGVIKDAEQRKALDRAVHSERIHQTNAHLLSQAFQTQTIEEEDVERRRAQQGDTANEELKRAWRRKRERQLREEKQEPPRFGLREVGKRTFVSAVERPGWVLVLVHEPDVPRCRPLLHSLVSLGMRLRGQARAPVLLQGRATALSFSLLPDDRSHSALPEEEDEEHSDMDDDEAGGRAPKRRADPDVLPSLLAYRNGELQETFIRVDWEVGADGAGLEDLLQRYGGGVRIVS